MSEIWKDIKNYEGLYQVSNMGSIRALNYRGCKERIKVLIPSNTKKYLSVVLCKDGKTKSFYIHKIVAETFLDKTKYKYFDEQDRIDNLDLKNLEVNHIDENKHNNRIENLEWCTRKYNAHYGNGREKQRQSQINHPKKSKPIIQYDLNGCFIKEWISIAEASRVISKNINKKVRNVTIGISACCRDLQPSAYGFRWKYK